MTDWPAPPGGITVRGGLGPSYADLDELRNAAGALRTAADLLEEAAERVAAAAQIIPLGSRQAPDTARAAADGLAPLLPPGAASLAVLASRTRELAHSLHAAAELYGVAEDRAGAIWRAVLSALGNSAATSPASALLAGILVGNLALRAGIVALGLRLLRGQPVPTLGEVVVALPVDDIVAGAGGLMRGLAPGLQFAVPAPVPDVSHGVVGAVGLASLALPSLARDPLLVTPRLGARRVGRASATAADVLGDVRDLYPAAGGAAGTVGIERIVRPDRSVSWVVAIPGTQSGGLGWGANPMDMDTNLRLMAGLANDGTRLVLRALAQAGVPTAEPILLAGHSQGGMVAMALAGSAAFTARYSVAAVLTAGSPVAAQVVPSSIPVLHLEHRQDLVPALDGAPSPTGVNRTTAVRDLRASSDPVDRLAGHDPGAAHRIDTYARTADAVSATGAPSVRAWEAAAGSVLGGAGSTAVRQEFTGTRTGSDTVGSAPAGLSAGRPDGAGRSSR